MTADTLFTVLFIAGPVLMLLTLIAGLDTTFIPEAEIGRCATRVGAQRAVVSVQASQTEYAGAGSATGRMP